MAGWKVRGCLFLVPPRLSLVTRSDRETTSHTWARYQRIGNGGGGKSWRVARKKVAKVYRFFFLVWLVFFFKI